MCLVLNALRKYTLCPLSYDTRKNDSSSRMFCQQNWTVQATDQIARQGILMH